MTIGDHLLKHWSTTQPTIALSSGEAELGGIVKGTTHGLGFQSLAEDLGVKVAIHVKTDATAAIGVCRRRGLGNIRHLHVADLWVQKRLQAGDFVLSKIAGSQNPADLFTKFLDRSTLEKLLPILNVHHEEGRADSAPQLAHVIMPQLVLPLGWRR